VIRLDGLNDTTGVFAEAETSNDRTVLPHNDRKLHSSISKVCTEPPDRYSGETWIGTDNKDFSEDEDWIRLVRYCSSRDAEEEFTDDPEEEEAIETWILRDFHSLPPDPEEELRSTSNPSHAPNTLGSLSRTNGPTEDKESAATGPDTVTLWETLKGQPSHTLVSFTTHAAFTTPLFSEITSPMFSRGDELTISRRLASTHPQRLPPPLNSTSEPDLYTRKNTEQSLSYLKLPPWFVADTNSIKILLPSDEKDTPRINGPATGSDNALTTNSDPAGKYTSYGAAEIGLEVPPLTSSTNTLTCKRYLPVSFPISSCRYTSRTGDTELVEVNETSGGANTDFAERGLVSLSPE
jgi:hypothetical protein